jgi:hypothetical protein
MSLSAQAASSLPLGPRTRNTGRVAHSTIAVLFCAVVFLLFAVSSGLLWTLGINYNGIQGAIASKIHPATYLSVIVLAVLVLARRNPASFFVSLVTRHPGTLAFLLATLMLAAYIVLDERKGIAAIFDTYLLAIMIALIAAELEGRDFARAEKLIHALLAANALLGLFEYAIDQRLIPFRFDGVTLEWDKRSNGLLGHPLENAQVTGLYIVVLLAGGGTLPKPLRAMAILLQLAALVPFGGRTALLLTLLLLLLLLIPRIARVLRGGRLSLPAFAAVAVLVPILVVGVGLFAAGGFFDVVLNRFANDDGSAKARLEMFEILGQLSWREIFIGADNGIVESLRRSHGLEQGIENPVVRLLLYQGAVFTAFLIAGFALFLIEISRRLRAGHALPMIFFLVIINSYESISNKTVALAQFVVLMLAMFSKSQPEPGRR